MLNGNMHIIYDTLNEKLAATTLAHNVRVMLPSQQHDDNSVGCSNTVRLQNQRFLRFTVGTQLVAHC